MKDDTRCKTCPRLFTDEEKVFDGGVKKEYNIFYCKDCDKDSYIFNPDWGKCPMCIGKDVDDLSNFCEEHIAEVKYLLARRRIGEY